MLTFLSQSAYLPTRASTVSAEVDSRPGTLRDRIAAMYREVTALFEKTVVAAQERGEIDRAADASQVTFEVMSMLSSANGSFLLHGDAAVLDRARRGVEVVLAAHARRRGR